MVRPGTLKSTSIRNVGLLLIPLTIILLAGANLRFSMLRQMGYRWDTYSFEEWSLRAVKNGLFNMYVRPPEGEGTEVDHPPIGIMLFALSTQIYLNNGGNIQTSANLRAADLNPDYVQALKYPVFIFDLLLVAAGYCIAWIEAKSRRWLWAALIGSALAFNPALLANSVWWGQTDGIVCFFLVLTTYALHRNSFTIAWFFYAIAMLTKFQALPLLPLLLVLTLRRGGIRKLIIGIGVAAIVSALVLLPFVIGSGLRSTLRPYVDRLGGYPFVTVKAHNFWFWILAPLRDMDALWYQMPPDSQATWGQGIYWGPFSARIVGLFIVGLCVFLVMRLCWIHPERDDEFLLATVLHMAFFMFATQMQVRYLYPALIPATFAVINHARLSIVWLGLSITVATNTLLLASHESSFWQPIAQILTFPQYQNALLNMLIMIALWWIVFQYTRKPGDAVSLQPV